MKTEEYTNGTEKEPVKAIEPLPALFRKSKNVNKMST